MHGKGILLVDDEALALKYFARAFGHQFPIFSAHSAQEALHILNIHHEEIGVILTDQRMPESTGVELLKIVRNRYPDTARVLTTAYTELDTLVGAINVGAVHSFVSKPWNLDELEKTLLNALEHHENQVQTPLQVDQKIDEIKSQFLDDRAYDVGLIAAKIGHYVHNALCPLTFLLDELLDKGKAGGAYSESFLQSVRKHIYDVSGTLKDLEKSTQLPTRDQYQLLDLEAMLDDALAQTEIMRNQKHFRFEREAASEPVPKVYGAPDQIQKLLRFMIAEEIVSLPDGSLVRLHLSAHRADNEILGANIEFEDYVPVAPHARVENLLQPFNLRGTNPREFGVFLVSCYFIARHHGGSLNVRIKPDRGISFSFFLPCHPPDLLPHDIDLINDFPPNRRPQRPPYDR